MSSRPTASSRKGRSALKSSRAVKTNDVLPATSDPARIPPSPSTSSVILDDPILHPTLPRLPSIPSLPTHTSKDSLRKDSCRISKKLMSPARDRMLRVSTSADTITQQTSKGTPSLLGRSLKRQQHSSDDPETSISTDDLDEFSEGEGIRNETDIPRRKAGFGLPQKPKAAKSGSTTGEEVEEEHIEDGKKENVVVCLRVRPTRSSKSAIQIYQYSPQEGRLSLNPHHPVLLKRGAMTKSLSANSRDEYEFRFDALHLSPAPTEDLYELKIRPVVRAAMNGFNGTVFAYGQTASGKTHTMMGNEMEPGIIPLAISELFSYIHEQNTSRSFSLRVSFLEIYNEQFRDLLLSSPRPLYSKALEVHGDDGTVKGLEERPVSMPSEVLALLSEGETRRRTGATDWNERSSRSHCVFVVTIESISKNEDGVARTSRLNLIDLAGSESATGQEERRKEGSFINKSLLTLGTVIAKLTEPRSSSSSHIPYRDSKLTRLLQPALSGNSRVAIICTISPDVEQATESLSTLKFAKRAKLVITKAERGTLLTEQMMLKQYAAQVHALQEQIAAKESGFQTEEILRERDNAVAKVDELHNRSVKAEEELAAKELELNRLREQLEHTKSFILTGPVLEANARRVSGQPGLWGAGYTPGKGKRRLSDMNILSIGSPRATSARIASANMRGSAKVGTLENEAELERKIEEAESRLLLLAQEKDNEIAQLKMKLDDLSSHQDKLENTQQETHNAYKLEERKFEERIGALESSLLIANAAVIATNAEKISLEMATKTLTASHERRGEELSSIRSTKEEVEAQLSQLQSELQEARATAASATSLASVDIMELEQKLSQALRDKTSAETNLLTEQQQYSELQEQLHLSERLTATLRHDLAKAQARDGRDDEIESLQRELGSVKKELASVTAAREASIQAALSEAQTAKKEREIALKSVNEARDRVKEIEELRDIQEKQHAVEMQQTKKEHVAELSQVQAHSDELSQNLSAKSATAIALQRSLDAMEELERQRTIYAANQRAGTDGLRTRLADLQARAAEPSLITTYTKLRKDSSTSGIRTSIDDSLNTVPELRSRNSELIFKIEDLEKQLHEGLQLSRSKTPLLSSSPSSDSGLLERKDAAEKNRLISMLELHKMLLGEAQTVGEKWRLKYLALQRDLEKDLASKSSADNENQPSSARSSLAAINLPARSKSTLVRLPPKDSPRDKLLYSNQVPPPLPYSPQMKDKERKLRRETISKDLAFLKESRGVERSRDLLGSPSGTPKKSLSSPLDGGMIQKPASVSEPGSAQGSPGIGSRASYFGSIVKNGTAMK